MSSSVVGLIALSVLAHICPGIRTLSPLLFSGDIQNGQGNHLLSFLSHCPFLRCFNALHKLCELETNTAIAQPEAFAITRGLPRLEHPTLCVTAAEPAMDPFSLPDHGFSALERLVLKDLWNTRAKTLLGLLPLVQNIKGLEAVTVLDWHEESWILVEFFPCLDNIPRLNNLSATLDEKRIVEELPDIDYPPVLNILSKLSFLTVYLNGVDSQGYLDLKNVFLTLTKLNISSQIVRLDLLVCWLQPPSLSIWLFG